MDVKCSEGIIISIEVNPMEMMLSGSVIPAAGLFVILEYVSLSLWYPCKSFPSKTAN